MIIDGKRDKEMATNNAKTKVDLGLTITDARFLKKIIGKIELGSDGKVEGWSCFSFSPNEMARLRSIRDKISTEIKKVT